MVWESHLETYFRSFWSNFFAENILNLWILSDISIAILSDTRNSVTIFWMIIEFLANFLLGTSLTSSDLIPLARINSFCFSMPLLFQRLMDPQFYSVTHIYSLPFCLDSSQIEPQILGPNRRPCSHMCNNKNACGHDCCKNGVVIRSTNQRATMMDSLRKELKQKKDHLPKTPLRPLKVQFIVLLHTSIPCSSLFLLTV